MSNERKKLIRAALMPAAHPDDAAVDAFAAAMKAKLKWEREERGRSGWQSMSEDDLSRLLYEHLPKGDPVDVANFCMMLSLNGQRIAPQDELAALRARVEKAEWERDDAIATVKLLQQQLKFQNDGFAARLSEATARAERAEEAFEIANKMRLEATRLAVEALEPFANRTFQFDGLAGEYFCNPSVQVNDLRRARTARDRLTNIMGESK